MRNQQVAGTFPLLPCDQAYFLSMSSDGIIATAPKVRSRAEVRRNEPPDSLAATGSSVLLLGLVSVDDQRTHHIVFFVLQNVAVPHVLVPPGAGAYGITH